MGQASSQEQSARSERGKRFASKSADGTQPIAMSRLAILSVAPLLIILALLPQGSVAWGAAMVLALLSGLTAAIALCMPEGRRALAQGSGLRMPAVGFGLAMLVVGLSLTPFLPGQAHPVWTFVDGPGAATVDATVTTLELIKLGGLGSLFLVGYVQGARRKDAEATLLIITLLVGLYAFGALILFLTDLLQAGPRLNAGLPSANVAGTLFGLLMVLGVAWTLRGWRRHRSKGRRIWADPVVQAKLSPGIGLVVLSLGALVFTASRGAMAATIVCLLTLGLWELAAGRLRLGLALSLVLLFVGVVVGLAVGGNVLLLDRSLATSSVEDGRLIMFETHWNAFLSSPLTGWGLGTFPQINAQYLNASSFPAVWNTQTAHNVYLQWLEEAGLLGALPMFFSIGAVIVLTTLALDRQKTGRTLLRGLVVVNLLVLIHGLTDFSLQVPAFASLWAFLLGLQLAWATTRQG